MPNNARMTHSRGTASASDIKISDVPRPRHAVVKPSDLRPLLCARTGIRNPPAYEIPSVRSCRPGTSFTPKKASRAGSSQVFRGGDASRPATESETTISSGGGRGDGGDEARLKKKKGTTPCFFAHSLPEHPKSLTSALWPLTTAQDGRGRKRKGEVVCLLAPSRRRALAVGGARGHVSVGVWKTRVGGLAPNVVGTKFPALSDSFWAGEGPP